MGNRRTTPPAERFWAKVDKTETCWLWTAQIMPNGYGRFALTRTQKIYAHIWAWQHSHGPVPDGLVLNHICHDPSTCPGRNLCLHRRCVNPAHMEAVPQRVNVTVNTVHPNMARLSPTHCANGHPKDVYWRTPATWQAYCQECARLRLAAWKHRTGYKRRTTQ